MSDTKKGKCPGCTPKELSGGAYFSRDLAYDDKFNDWVWVWKCNNCGWTSGEIKRRNFKRNIITKAQQRTIDRLKDTLHGYWGGTNEYEWKKWEVETTDYGPVWLTAESGMVNDQGTMASIFCRDYWHISIGPRGKIKSHSKPDWHDRKRDNRI